MMNNTPVVELRNITKRFAKVLANDKVCLTINKGEVVAILGENGAGKSTCMKILYGLYSATSGEIIIDGERKRIDSPKDAVNIGISMIQQHFSLVQAHTVTENIILGSATGVVDYREKEKEIQKLADEHNLNISATDYIKDLSVGAKQKVEILKALYTNAKILIMDEPTAVLTPQESRDLVDFVRDYAAQGNSVVFITHKLKEVMAVADRIVIMRNGEVTGIVQKDEINEIELASLMMGRTIESLHKATDSVHESKGSQLIVENISIDRENEVSLLSNVSFEISKGEILGIAGVSGNGQQELCETIYGCLQPTSGRILLDGEDITYLKVQDHISRGIGYLVSDRHRYGMVPEMTLSENMLLKSTYLDVWVKKGLINWKKVDEYTDKVIDEYNVKAPDSKAIAESLSGGNQQKLVVAREVDMGDKLILIDQPTRGLDIGAVNFVHQTILDERAKGKSILLVSTDLSEVLALSDRIAVLYEGKIMKIFNNGDLTIDEIGLLMAGYTGTDKDIQKVSAISEVSN